MYEVLYLTEPNWGHRFGLRRALRSFHKNISYTLSYIKFEQNEKAITVFDRGKKVIA